MRTELRKAVNFIKEKALTKSKVGHIIVDLFTRKLFAILCDKYVGRWYPDCEDAYR